ncbi:MAG: DNA-processing protein DprA [Verrucomicrobiota bacterium]
MRRKKKLSKPSEEDVDRRDAFIILNSLPDIGSLRINSLITFFGSPEGVLKAGEKDLQQIAGIGPKIAATIAGWEENCDIEMEKQAAKRADVTIITRDDQNYPALLHHIHDPPVCLYVRGNPAILSTTSSSVAMVGSRRITNYGTKMADTLGTAAAVAGWPVVSGLARGIDTCVHEAVVRMNGCAIAVLGSGLGRIYPQENIGLARRITAKGAVVSEFPMTFAPMKRTFPMRNRIISGMTKGTVVIEAGHRSGSLITANMALEQNRLVFAVPGRADSPQSRGCNQLIREGATLTESFDDILENFSFLPGFNSISSSRDKEDETDDGGTHKQTSQNTVQLTELEQRILDVMDTDEVLIDNLVAEVGETIPKVFQALFSLEMKKFVRQLPGKRVVRVDGQG